MTPAAMNIHVSIHAHPRYLVATDAAALLLVVLMLFAVSRLRYLVSPLAFLLLAIAAVLGFAADIGLWLWKGIRAAELEDDTLTVYRGPSLQREVLIRATVLRVKISRLAGNRHVTLRTLSGRRLKIFENAFQHEEFSRFLAALEMWSPPRARAR